MNIVVLDGYTLNPGDLTWDGLKALGKVTVFDRTPPAQVSARAAGAAIVLTNKTRLGSAELAALPGLRYIGVLGTGYNVVEIAAAKTRGIVVTNVPAYGTPAVAQMTFALLLELAHRVGHHSRTVREGRWTESADFCYWDYPLLELHGLTMGLVGFGHIGRAVAEIAKSFGMKVLAYARHPPAQVPAGVRLTDLDTLFRESDVVSLHCPLTADNANLVDAARLALMKPAAFLINTARGPLVHEADLAAALQAGRIAGAGLDVLAVEPPGPDNPLLKAKNCIITPHIAWATRAARQRLMDAATANVRAFLAGTPQNVVNG